MSVIYISTRPGTGFEKMINNEKKMTDALKFKLIREQ